MATATRSVFPADFGAALWADWKVLAEEIGIRAAGTAAELRAAAHVAGQFARAGLTGVAEEAFPCTSVRSSATRVEARIEGRWKRVESAALTGARATPHGRAVDGEAVWLEMPEEAGRLAPGSLRGKICLLFGPLPTEVDHHRKLMAAAPAAVVHVDERLPFAWTKNDGVYPHWARRYGMPPIVTVPYLEAWGWKRDGVRRLRVAARVEQVEALSRNVIGRVEGSDPRLPEIILCAHHDSQRGNPGADDNASGVICLLGLARLLGRSRPHRSLRLISFGTEEQLSVGSAAYVRAHRGELDRIGFVINFDSVASPLGHWFLSVIGGPALRRFAARALARSGIEPAVSEAITPFVDNFAFNHAGIPSLWLHRSNFPGGRWQHHSRHDTLDNVSLDEVLRLLGAVGPMTARLARAAKWPFPRSLTPSQRADARRLGRELFGFSPR